MWASPDRPPTERAARNYCFGLKYILKDTFDNPYKINVSDSSPYEVHVGGQLAVTVTVDGTAIHKNWDDKWKAWEELQGHPLLKELSDKCDALVTRAQQGMKGHPKGKSKGQ